MRTIRRDELYEQVWKIPLREIARAYGLADVELAKICKRLDVPRPPQGHWVRVQHGQAVARVPLPPLAPGMTDHLVVSGETRVDKPPAARLPATKISIVDNVTGPHPALRTLMKQLGPDYRHRYIQVVRYPGQSTLRVSKASEKRAVQILDALCRWLSGNGYTVETVEHPTDERHHMLAVGHDDMRFRISLVERLKQVAHVPTAKEKADAARYSFMRPPKMDLVPTGKFVLEFLQDDAWPHAYGTWKDGQHTIEEQLDEAVVRIPGIFLEIEGAKRARVEAVRREQEAALVREEEAKRAHYVAALVDDLDEMAARWKHAHDIREFVIAAESALLATADGDPSGRRAWVEWARGYADSIDPLSKPGSIAKALSPRS